MPHVNQEKITGLNMIGSSPTKLVEDLPLNEIVSFQDTVDKVKSATSNFDHKIDRDIQVIANEAISLTDLLQEIQKFAAENVARS